MKQTSRGLAPSLNTGHSTFTGARQRLAVALVAIVIAFAGAQTAGAQNTCNVKFYISSGGTVELPTEYEWLEVTNGETIPCLIPSVNDLTITPETGYYVSSVTYDAPAGLSIDLNQRDDFHWYLYINPYEGSKTPTITVYIVFDKALAGGADEASAVALTADDDLSRLTGGWYKVESDLTFGHTVNLHGDTHITIATGKTLTVNTSDEYGISGSALTVSGEGMLNVSANQIAISVDNYTQTGCAVTLSGETDGLTAENNVSISGGSLRADYGIETNQGAITISGGTVSASGDQCGLYACDAVSITGGTVSASGNNYGIRGYSVSITGGQVTASSGGIRSNYGDITLGLTSATDYITASGYVLQIDGKHVKIADGQKLYGGGFPSASFKGTVDDPSALNGLMLRPTAAVTKSGTNEYTIWNAAGWDAFCDMLEAGETFSGKTIVLAGDIGTPEDPVNRMGSSTTQFQGTFDGQGHTLTVQYGTPSEPVNQQFVAPFPKVAGAATFRSLTIAGSIYSGYDTSGDKGTGGLIGHLFGGVTVEHCVSTVTVNAASDRAGGFVGLCEHAVTFTDCVSSATVTCTGSGSGFVGWSRDSKYTIAFYGCLFSGKVLKQGNVGSGNGSFVGWKGFSKTVTITNCIAAPATDENMATDNSATFCRYSADTTKDNGETDITNCYYTAAFDIAQGKQARAVTAGTDVTVAHAGVATHYATSGITAYKATGASTDSDPFIAGLLYNNNVVDVLYAGSDEVVSLTLSNTGAPDGYQYGYTTNAGTLSGSTLTMPDEDVTVSVNTEVLVAIDWATVSTGADKDNAYMIYNKDQLDLLAHRVNGTHGETAVEDGYSGKYFKLGKDIKYTHTTDWDDAECEQESNFEAIGGKFNNIDRSFRGHFDGGGNTISGIRIYKNGISDADNYQGIFGRTDEGADIHDLTLADARITGYLRIGGIVGHTNGGTVSGCHVADDVAVCAVQSSAWYHGGIMGSNNYNNSTIAQCTSAVTLTIAANCKYFGGIAGRNYGTLRDNLAIGATVPAAADNYYGAITGRNYGTLQRNYYTACNVAGVENATGVGCGYIGNDDDGYITADVNNVNNPNGAVSIHTLTLADGITTTTPVTVTIGTTGYYAQGTAIALSYSGDVPLGYQYGFTASAGTISGSTLTMPAADVTVSALRSTHAAVEVSYVDAGGTPQTAQAIALDGTEPELTAGWYFVGRPTVAFDHTLYLSGDVNLILADGCTMNVTSSNDYGIHVDGSLTIYGQTDGTGALNATSGNLSGIYTFGGTITISGGRVTATGDNETGISTDSGTITISGGRVTATSDNGFGIHSGSGDITISGGTVTATGDNGDGIFTDSGTITLGCTTASDFIYASSYGVGSDATLNIAYGQELFDEDGNSYSGTLNDYDFPDGKTLRPGLTARQAPDGNYWTTYYNSFQGFTIDNDENACAYTATYGDGKLTLHNQGKQIPAGMAVIIVAENNVVSMTTNDYHYDFNDPNDLCGVDDDTPTSALGTGTFYVLGMTTVDNEQHFGFHRYTGSEMAAHKAFLHVPGSSNARSLDMVFANEETGIGSIESGELRMENFYTLDGRKLNGKPTKPGLYINNGRKVVIK